MNHPKNKTRPHLQDNEARFFGKNACLAIWKYRPNDVIRIYVREDLKDDFSELLTWAAKNKKSYHVVKENDLERLADTVHHQGICLIAKRKPKLTFGNFFKEVRSSGKVENQTLLFLDGVENPHNLGAILRTASFLGVRYILGQKGKLPRLSPAATRTAEGAAEIVTLVESDDLENDFENLRGLGFGIFATDVRQGSVSLFETKLPARTVIILGAEVSGVSNQLHALSDSALHIPGTGEMESLNVSVAAGILMAECIRQRSGARRLVRKELKS